MYKLPLSQLAIKFNHLNKETVQILNVPRVTERYSEYGILPAW